MDGDGIVDGQMLRTKLMMMIKYLLVIIRRGLFWGESAFSIRIFSSRIPNMSYFKGKKSILLDRCSV